jgi:hypothetical protein
LSRRDAERFDRDGPGRTVKRTDELTMTGYGVLVHGPPPDVAAMHLVGINMWVGRLIDVKTMC